MIIGSKAPDFSLFNDEGNKITFSQLLGKTIILYFYPKDDTPGCTKQALDFKHFFCELSPAMIFGISKDNINSHYKFRNKYYNLITFRFLRHT